MSAKSVSLGEYRERVIHALARAGCPVTIKQLRESHGLSAGHDRIVEALESLESDGLVVRGKVTKFNRTFTTWSLIRPANRVNGFHGHSNGKATDDLPLTYFDARKLVEDLFLGLESLKQVAEQLESALLDWPNLPIRELVERHCHATGKDMRAIVCAELLPLAIELGKEPAP